METMGLPRYKCHKEVGAAKILGIKDGDALVLCDAAGFVDQVYRAGFDWMEKHNPESGGYLVQYDDGYVSYSPAEPFEAGYAPVIVPPAPEFRDNIMQFFAFEHLPDRLKAASRPFCELANWIEAALPRNPERTVALRKLLEAKDAAVRALVAK